MKKKLIGVVALVLGCFAMCVGCSGSAKSITLTAGEKSKFVIVGDTDKNYVSAVVSKVNTLTGATPEVYTKEEAPENQTRIVIGNPDELQVGEIISEVPYFGYLVSVRDGDIYILAYHDEVLVEAVTTFLDEFEGWNSNGKIKVAGDYEVVSTVSDTFPVGEVPYLEGSENASVHDYDDEHQVVVLEGVKKEEFEAYCDKLVADGFELYAENEINGNLFMTYYNEGGKMIHTYWIEHFEEVRTVVANTELLPITSNADAESICTPLLHQMKGLEEEGYIIRLADGRFIIIDGGNPTEENVNAIYSFLKENAPDPNNISIATWYITHAHTDHCGALAAFSEKYSTDSSITLESIMFNPCETTEQMIYCSASYKTNLDVALSTYYADVPVYKPLTGQVYTFGKTTIEILYTMSDFMPNTIEYESDGKGGDYNVMSTVCIIDIDSTADIKDRWFVMGDTTTVACNEMCYRYGDYMKCNFVQVSHHGLSPLPTGANCRRHCATIEIYELIDPDIALWPTNAEKVQERIELEVNDYLASIVDEIVIAGDGGRTFEIK